MQLIVASRNAHKTGEIRSILGPQFEVNDLRSYPEILQVPESGRSFEQNARRKAVAVSKQIPGFVIADDSGLEVDALGGEPGIYSARYAGKDATDGDRIDKLLLELKRAGATKGDCRARFRCVIALACDGNIIGTFEGIAEGKIADKPRGSHGFGYDPIFVPKGFQQTFAELSAEVKNTISHRAKAVRTLAAELEQLAPGD